MTDRSNLTYHVSFDIDFKKNPYPGKLIVIEGIDGSGKTTQLNHLVARLIKEGIPVVAAKEPTVMVIGEFIREKILSGKEEISPIALQYLFNADRAMHMDQIEGFLKEGKTVVMDRYFWSSVAYALADIGEVGDYYLAAFSVLSFYHRFIVPDSTIYLDIPLPLALERIKKSQKHFEIYDKEEKLKKILAGYQFLREKFPEQFTVIDASQDSAKITEEIAQKV